MWYILPVAKMKINVLFCFLKKNPKKLVDRRGRVKFGFFDTKVVCFIDMKTFACHILMFLTSSKNLTYEI